MSMDHPMPRTPFILIGGFAAAVVLSGCGDETALPKGADTGPNPSLPKPVTSAVPTVNVAPAKGWATGELPTAAAGLTVGAFARGLNHPRSILVLPNGDVLVAESNAPPKEQSTGIRGFVMKLVMDRAGAGVPSPNRVILLRDADGDGTAEVRSTYIEGLTSPFGLTLIGDRLYVANADSIVAFPYVAGSDKITAAAEKIVDLPGGPLNHHWTKSLIASPDGRFLYVGVGSNSNVGENGMEMEKDRAAILEVDVTAKTMRPFATGLRNPVGMAWEPGTKALWTVVNERDELGSDLVPDYLTKVIDGSFYGWPYSYFGTTVDERVTPQRPDLVAKAVVPDYALGAHTASLGLAFSPSQSWPRDLAQGAFIAQHGSWNRKPHSGYKVVFVPFENGRPNGAMRDVLTGFLSDDGDALGRPVSVAFTQNGTLLVTDDVGNAVWSVRPQATQSDVSAQ
jgi:glucose/arabinose dehydrogenase